MHARTLLLLMALGAAFGNVRPMEAAQPKAPGVNKAPGNKGPGNKGPGNPGLAVERFAQMSPEQREKALARLPPARRQQIEQRLQAYEKLSPQQKQRLQERLEAFQSLPPNRRVAVRQELQYLRSLPPAQRRARLRGPAIEQNFSPEEQQLLRGSFGQPNP
jgi:hypothetical protein